jgi:UDP-N-acetylglucosamine acyltransferase
VSIEDWAILEGMVGVQQFVTIGQHSFVAGGSMVRKNIPPFVKAAREPLSFIGVNSIGLRRRGFDNEQVVNIEDIYRTLYVQNGNISQALRVAETELPHSEEKTIVLGFISASDKGIIRGPF